MTTERKEMLHDAFGAPAALGDDDRSFAQQMRDLGVEVIKPERPRPEWYKKTYRDNTKGGLQDKISLNSGCITVGKMAANMLGWPNTRLNIGVVRIKNKDYIVIKPCKTGFVITKTLKNSYRVGTKALVKWLNEGKGIARGAYSLKEIEGGWLAIPEGGGDTK